MADTLFFSALSPIPDSKCPFYRNACQFCYRDGLLKRCSNCKSVWYCSKQHQIYAWPFHKRHCKAIKLTNETIPYVVESRNDLARYKTLLCASWEATMKRSLTVYEFSVSENLPVCEVCWKREGLYECGNCKCVWFCGKDHEQAIRPVHQKYCEALKLCRLTDLYRIQRYDVIQAISSHVTSRINSLIYSIVMAKFKEPMLNVHIVGSAEDEARSVWDFSLMRYTRLRDIRLSFIGPDVVPFKVPMCPHVTVNYAFYKKCYHEVANDLAKPHLIICFNAGLHVDRKWTPSIRYMVQKGVSLVITAYNEAEMQLDRRELLNNSNGLEFIVDAVKNPERSTKPFRDSETLNHTSVFFVNEYVCICRGTV